MIIRTYNSRTMSPEQWRQYMKARRIRLVGKIHQHMGGRCECCGEVERLEIHHRDRAQKNFNPTRVNRAWSAIVEELKLCELLCRRCHKKQHYARHGSLARYRNHGCRCDACVAVYKPWKAAVDRRHYAKRQLQWSS